MVELMAGTLHMTRMSATSCSRQVQILHASASVQLSDRGAMAVVASLVQNLFRSTPGPLLLICGLTGRAWWQSFQVKEHS